MESKVFRGVAAERQGLPEPKRRGNRMQAKSGLSENDEKPEKRGKNNAPFRAPEL
jgi:hypothetical protein